MSPISQTLSDGLAVLLAIHRGQTTRAEIGEALGLERTKVYRLLSTLEQCGFVVERGSGQYALTAMLAALAPMPYQLLREVAQQPLTDLAARTKLTAHVTVADGSTATAVSVMSPPAVPFYVAYRIGSTHPIDRGAAGLAMLANRDGTDVTPELAAISVAGYAVTWGQLQAGAVGLAVALDLGLVEASVGVISVDEIDEAAIALDVGRAKSEIEAAFANREDRAP